VRYPVPPTDFSTFIVPSPGILDLGMLFLLKFLVFMLTPAGEKIVKEAKSKGLWIYDPVYKKWYSPEDFQHIFYYANSSDELIDKLQVRHPVEGIEAGFKRLTEIQNKLQGLINLVVNYYKK
jgi:hypothetical protein